MSTKDYLKGLAITIIPYCKSRKADAVGEIAEVVTETSFLKPTKNGCTLTSWERNTRKFAVC